MDHFLKIAMPWLLIVLAGCGRSERACTMNAVYAVNLLLSPEPVRATVTVRPDVGGAQIMTCYASQRCVNISTALELHGHVTIEIVAEGYVAQTVSTNIVFDGCHPIPQTIAVTLTPAP